MNAQTLLFEKVSDYTLQVTLNRDAFHNAINVEMMQDLNELWQELSANPSGIRAIILTGAGKKAFCAGADLKERASQTTEQWTQAHQTLESSMLAMLNCPIPIISAVNGVAYGGGLELVLCSDFAIGSKKASFCQSEAKWGLIPGAMGTQLLPRAVGLRRAKDMLFTSRVLDAKMALEWGLLNEVTLIKDLMPRAVALAKMISDNSPIAIKAGKAALMASQESGPEHGYSIELEHYYNVLNKNDRIEGISAFSEKRDPVYKD